MKVLFVNLYFFFTSKLALTVQCYADQYKLGFAIMQMCLQGQSFLKKICNENKVKHRSCKRQFGSLNK